MLFNSLSFALFFPVVTALYFLLPQRWRWALLLGASAIFYMAFVPAYILIMAFTVTVDYVAGRLIESSHGRRRFGWLLASLVANVGVLGFFKYYGFMAGNLVWLRAATGVDLTLPPWTILLPLGLSFHTFQAMSYTIEVYRGHVPAERHIGYYALYVMFFPQLVAGPIERPERLLPQLRSEHHFDYARVVSGLKRMALGLFKKMVVADQLAVTVDRIYADPTAFHGLALVIGCVFFAVQGYYDFAGYSDIAIGSARVMGIDLTTNFRAPFAASSLSEFWRRWHVSLGRWFHDYVYTPMLNGRQSRQTLAVLVVFTISGLWHGADWTFVLWGVSCGLLLVGGRITRAFRRRLGLAQGGPGTAITIFLLFAVPAILFRAQTLDDAVYVMTHMHVGLFGDLADLLSGGVVAGLSVPMLMALVLLAGLQLWMDVLDDRRDVFERLAAWPVAARYSVYFVLVYSCLVAGSVRSPQQFVYFQF